jgi:3-phenylpropionate/trans-cinnamate dioxygenase ferredoxin subunit
MADWISVARVGELADGAYRLVELSGSFVAVYRIGEEYHAIEDLCTHDGGELAGGPVEGHTVECIRHGARFDLKSGAALNPPAYTGVEVFPVQVEGGVIYVRDHRYD